MKRYSPERKEAVLRKLVPPMNLTVPEVAEAEGISTASLYNWRRQAREQGEILPSRGSAPEQWSSEDKFRVVLETAAMNQAAFSAYCRERGLYPEQVEAWRASCMSANAKAGEKDTHSRQVRKQEQSGSRSLSGSCAARTKPSRRRRRC